MQKQKNELTPTRNNRLLRRKRLQRQMNRAVLSDLEQQDKLRSFNSEHRPLRRKYKQSKCHNRKYPRRQNLAAIILRKLVHKFNQNRTTRNLR